MQPFISHQDGHEVHFSSISPHKDNSYIYICKYMHINIFLVENGGNGNGN